MSTRVTTSYAIWRHKNLQHQRQTFGAKLKISLVMRLPCRKVTAGVTKSQFPTTASSTLEIASCNWKSPAAVNFKDDRQHWNICTFSNYCPQIYTVIETDDRSVSYLMT